MIQRELAEGVLKPLPLVQGSIRRPLFYLYTNPDKPLGPATQILIDLIKTYDAQSQTANGGLAQASTLTRTTS
jgi:DNA-binding transcriptional LysR family regulator